MANASATVTLHGFATIDNCKSVTALQRFATNESADSYDKIIKPQESTIN
jgi:hypothetical protein